jgi:hypothetical protein
MVEHEIVCGKLGLTLADDPAARLVASKIIELAQRGVRQAPGRRGRARQTGVRFFDGPWRREAALCHVVLPYRLRRRALLRAMRWTTPMHIPDYIVIGFLFASMLGAGAMVFRKEK